MNHHRSNFFTGNINTSLPSIYLRSMLLILCIAINSSAVSVIRENNGCKPWMLFVTEIIPPKGPQYSSAFTSICYEKIKTAFDTTSYQAIQLNAGQTPEELSNNKKDLIISSDPREFWIKGKTIDTLIFWIRYRVGFVHSKVSVPYPRGQGNLIPELIAQQALSTILSEFVCSMALKGGPPQMSIKVTDDIIVYPPCSIYLPPGNYSFESSFPGFKTRVDSISLFPGKDYTKRILLLPE